MQFLASTSSSHPYRTSATDFLHRLAGLPWVIIGCLTDLCLHLANVKHDVFSLPMGINCCKILRDYQLHLVVHAFDIVEGDLRERVSKRFQTIHGGQRWVRCKRQDVLWLRCNGECLSRRFLGSSRSVAQELSHSINQSLLPTVVDMGSSIEPRIMPQAWLMLSELIFFCRPTFTVSPHASLCTFSSILTLSKATNCQNNSLIDIAKVSQYSFTLLNSLSNLRILFRSHLAHPSPDAFISCSSP